MGSWASPYLEGQASYLRHLATASHADVVEYGDAFAVRTGVASNSENGVVTAGDVRVERELAHDVVRWFAARSLPAVWLLGEGDRRPETARVLEAVGCRPERSAWEMRADLDALDLRDARRDVEVTPVRTMSELEAWLDVAGACGWFETAEERQASKTHHRALIHSERVRLFLARRGARAVGMASAFYDERLVLLTAVAVLAEERRQGVAKALALARLHEARERDCRVAVLAPTPDGARLYGALGFERHPQPADRSFYLPVSDGRA